MNKTVLAIVALAAPAFAVDDGLISLGEPGFYGRLELGDDSPRPETSFPEPRLVEHVAHYQDSIYLRVRPGENREWALHCHKYEACGRYVYFVNDDWYTAVYVPYYRDRGHHDPRDDEPERVDNARLEEEYREDHRNDEHRGDPGDYN